MKTQTLPTPSRILEITIPALVVFAVSWGIYTSKSNAQEVKINDLETKYATLLDMKTDIALVRQDTTYIKNNMDELKVALERHIEQ